MSYKERQEHLKSQQKIRITLRSRCLIKLRSQSKNVERNE